ncbi:hypothetical protein D3C76_373240 [compost metagenome]
MHVVVFDLVDPHRLEGARADVQGHEGPLHALGGNLLQQRLVEVQAGRGRCDRTGTLGVDGLVALTVGALVGAVDIGRQRHVPDAFEQWQHLFGEAQLEQRFVARDHFGLATAIDENLRTHLGRLAGAHVGQYPVAVQHAFDQHFQLAAGGFLAEQARRDNPGIVEYHQVARAQIVEQIGELLMYQGAARPIEDQQTATMALGQRVAGDQGIGEFEGKIGDAHDDVRFGRAGKFSPMCEN